MAAVDSAQAAGNILANITDTNISETNLKVVYSIYQQTWMQGVYEFSSADSTTLYNIALQNAADAGESVFAARVLLGIIVDESGVSSARYGTEPSEADQAQSIGLYPNPASNSVNGNLELEEEQTAVVNVIDLQGKVVKSVFITTSGMFTLDVSHLDNGLYFVQVFIGRELIDSGKLEIIHE